MINLQPGVRWCVALGCLLLHSAVCAHPKDAWFSPLFDPSGIEHILVLPVVDLRSGGDSAKVNAHREMKRAIRIHVGKRRYPIERATDLALIAPIDQAWLEAVEQAPPVAALSALESVERRYVLLLVLHNLRTERGVTTKTKSTMTGYLFDVAGRTRLWQHTASYEWGTGLLGAGPLGALGMSIGSQGTALLQVTRSVMQGLPKRPKQSSRKQS